MSQHQEYPKAMSHPQFRPAVNAKWDIREKDPQKQPQGSPVRFPPVIVHNFDQEQYHAAQGYRPDGVSDPEAYRRAMTGNNSPANGGFQEYPKYLYRLKKGAEEGEDDVESTLVETAAAEAQLTGKWFATPDAARKGVTSAPAKAAAGACNKHEYPNETIGVYKKGVCIHCGATKPSPQTVQAKKAPKAEPAPVPEAPAGKTHAEKVREGMARAKAKKQQQPQAS